MIKLEDRLQAIAHMMDAAPGYTPDEVLVWRELIRYVDRACFERTGRIVATGFNSERIAARTMQTMPPLSASAVEQALQQLMVRGHLIIERARSGGPAQYRLFLFSREAPGLPKPHIA